MFSSSVIFLLVDACVGLNWLLVGFLSHVNKNIIHSFIRSKSGIGNVLGMSYKSDIVLGVYGYGYGYRVQQYGTGSNSMSAL